MASVPPLGNRTGDGSALSRLVQFNGRRPHSRKADEQRIEDRLRAEEAKNAAERSLTRMAT